jgi:hypothetical protein
MCWHGHGEGAATYQVLIEFTLTELVESGQELFHLVAAPESYLKGTKRSGLIDEGD